MLPKPNLEFNPELVILSLDATPASAGILPAKYPVSFADAMAGKDTGAPKGGITRMRIDDTE